VKVATYSVPGVSLDLRELELGVVFVHGLNLLAGGRAQHLDDLHQLIHATLAWEQRLAQQELCQHAAHGPNVCTAVTGKRSAPSSKTTR
jgi:hypothetical protein